MIPSACKVCGGELSADEMRCWLRCCERLGWDPIESATRCRLPGILCFGCLWLSLMEGDVHAELRDAVLSTKREDGQMRRDACSTTIQLDDATARLMEALSIIRLLRPAPCYYQSGKKRGQMRARDVERVNDAIRHLGYRLDPEYNIFRPMSSVIWLTPLPNQSERESER